MNAKERHIVIVNFTTSESSQAQAIQEVGDYVESFLSHQLGFIASQLHASLDGRSLVHYAEWVSEKNFMAAAEKARSHPDLPMLMAYSPNASGYKIHRRFCVTHLATSKNIVNNVKHYSSTTRSLNTSITRI